MRDQTFTCAMGARNDECVHTCISFHSVDKEVYSPSVFGSDGGTLVYTLLWKSGYIVACTVVVVCTRHVECVTGGL